MTNKKPIDKRRREVVTIWVSADEKSRIEASALAAGLTVSEFLRRLALADPDPPRPGQEK